MTKKELDEIEARCTEAHRGQWRYETHGQDVPALVAEVKRLQEGNANLIESNTSLRKALGHGESLSEMRVRVRALMIRLEERSLYSKLTPSPND